MFNYYYYTNSYYMLGNILVLVGVALMALAQMKVSSAYNKYSKVQNSRHLTGYDVAREILDQHGLSSVQGSLDVFAGNVKRAPKFFQKLGLEWFYRLLKEPKRIGRMMKLPKFLFAAIGCKLRGKKHHGEG